jgi:CHAT domain-containing protein
LDNNRSESVLATLWRVNDNTTGQFMKNFYQNLSKNTDKNPITRSDALRQAQLNFLTNDKIKSDIVRGSFTIEDNSSKINSSLLRDLSHPYYWSPFVLMGSGF